MSLKKVAFAIRAAFLRFLVGGLPLTERSEPWVRHQLLARQTFSLARAAANAATRVIDPTRLETWEFSGFSQNGEDGVLDYLCSRLQDPRREFLEIGASNGMENCSAFLAVAKQFNGLMVEGQARHVKAAEIAYAGKNLGLRFLNLYVGPDNIDRVISMLRSLTPDVFSLDIDSIDYYVAKALFDKGFRPGIIVAEYNSAFGPERACTVAFRENFDRMKIHESGVYYGVSVQGWRRLFEAHGYTFLGVESKGVNAFFAKTDRFDPEFLRNIRPTPFRENFVQPRNDWNYQWGLIQHLPIQDL
ncbi:hypothetical protein GC173_04105 [bacterium]|nr:hypothetical protein [bacterium]